MKRVIMCLLVLVLTTGMVYAEGGQNQGSEGTGEVDQGETGSETGNAAGDDAQENQT